MRKVLLIPLLALILCSCSGGGGGSSSSGVQGTQSTTITGLFDQSHLDNTTAH